MVHFGVRWRQGGLRYEEKSARCPLPNETAHHTSGLYRRGLEVFGLAHKTGGRLRLGVRTYVERYEHVEVMLRLEMWRK